MNTGPAADAWSAAFPGGDVAIRKPTRADLMLSAKQWIDRVRDDIVDARHPGVILASLDRLDAVLVELGVTL